MAEHPRIRTIHNVAAEIAEQNVVAKQAVAKALEVLKQPPPDTFLGRKTQETFPNEE